MSYVPVILVAPSFTALRTAYGVLKDELGATVTDENGGVPAAPWYKRSHTPPIWKMKDGTPVLVDGALVTPRVRDLTSAKLAVQVVLSDDEAAAIRALFPANIFDFPAGLSAAQAAHPALEWSSLGRVWGFE